jgi:hypothetical protein
MPRRSQHARTGRRTNVAAKAHGKVKPIFSVNFAERWRHLP